MPLIVDPNPHDSKIATVSRNSIRRWVAEVDGWVVTHGGHGSGNDAGKGK